MQKKINRILEGNFDYDKGSLDFSCEKIELSMDKGQRIEGSFHIFASPGLFTGGTVFSSDLRMECLTGSFVGSEEEILFRFHGETLEAGDVVKGNFYVVSNHGEYALPFEVTVEQRMPESSVGRIENLTHFANLAKSNWQEALKLFYSPDFSRILSANDNQYAEDYRALSVYPGWEQNMEEFLICVGKKQKVEYIAKEEQLAVELDVLEASCAVLEREVPIVKNGWGFTQLFVECTGDFLFTEKEVLTDDDFLGNHCSLPVFIDSSLCRRGRNFGRICLHNSYVTLSIPVTVTMADGSSRHNQDLARKRCTVQLMEFYQAFRLRKIGTATWLKESGKLVDKLVGMNEKDIAARLFQAQLLITEERGNEAGWILDHVADLLENEGAEDSLLAYYLYLTTLIHEDEKYLSKVTRDVQHIYRKDTTNWRVAWLLLYLAEDYRKSATGKWVFLEKLFSAGCSSPMLYMEALALINHNPVLLRKLGRFELQALYFGAKQEALKPEVVEQLLYLSAKNKEYAEILYKALAKIYEKNQDARLLQEICALLIKGCKSGSSYFEWYKRGVAAQLRITNLYEYYMMSLDLEKPEQLPKIVLMYFSYQNNLDYAHTAYLYNYILQNKEALGDVFETYRFKIEHFVEVQIKKGRINSHLADIYNRSLKPEMVNEQTAAPFSRLLFAHLLRVEDDRLKKVYVYQPGNLSPQEYTLSEKRTCVSLYGSDYTIVFEDVWRNRFISSVPYTVEKLLAREEFLPWLQPYETNNLAFDLYLCSSRQENVGSPEESLARKLRIVGWNNADSKVKEQLYPQILKYYSDAGDTQAVNAFLESLSDVKLSASKRGELLRYLALCGNYELFENWLAVYGPYFAKPKLAARLLGPVLERHNMEYHSVLLAAANYVFDKGAYDSTILNYLVQYDQGTISHMRDIWLAARNFGLDARAISERILVQMLYTGEAVEEKMPIFGYYIAGGANRKLEKAFLTQCAYDYFVKEAPMEAEVFERLKLMYLQEEALQKVCKLAFLKYCAQKRPETDSAGRQMMQEFLAEMMEEGILLEFFKEFKECGKLQRELADKTIVEYRANPQCRAAIHYTVLTENEEVGEQSAEYMKEACEGVFFKEFILFFGESVRYYISEEKDGEAHLTESGTLRKEDIGEAEIGSRYRRINDIITGNSVRDFEAMDNLLEEYYKDEFLNSKLFVLD